MIIPTLNIPRCKKTVKQHKCKNKNMFDPFYFPLLHLLYNDPYSVIVLYMWPKIKGVSGGLGAHTFIDNKCNTSNCITHLGTTITNPCRSINMIECLILDIKSKQGNNHLKEQYFLLIL